MLRRALAAASVAGLCASGAGCSNTTCTSLNPIAGAICIPVTIAPDQNAVIQVREACGQCSSQPTCDTTFRDGAVYLDLSSEICTDVSITCPSTPCLQRLVRCTLPPLASGDYQLIAPGSQQYLLHVRSGGVSSCTFAPQ
jgi:hypothetical protein